MSKIKLTKGELKRQRDSLKQFQRYLPTLQLKKQQLQMKILEFRRVLAEKQAGLNRKEESLKKWIELLADPQLGDVDLKPWVVPEAIETETINIAGAALTVLKSIRFRDVKYDFYATPFWLDRGIEELRAYFSFLVEVMIVKKQIVRLEHELRITTQRVNLFEKIKIPEAQEHIRKIRICLGDQQANAVGISKVAKKKLVAQEVPELAMAG